MIYFSLFIIMVATCWCNSTEKKQPKQKYIEIRSKIEKKVKTERKNNNVKILTMNTNNNSTNKNSTVFVTVVVKGLYLHWSLASLSSYSTMCLTGPLAAWSPCHGVDTPSAARIRCRTFCKYNKNCGTQNENGKKYQTHTHTNIYILYHKARNISRVKCKGGSYIQLISKSNVCA